MYVNGKLRNHQPPVTLRHKDSGAFMSTSDAVEAFNAYFGSVYVSDNGNLANFNKIDFAYKFGNDVDFCHIAVGKAIGNASDTFSCGPDGLCAYMLRTIKSKISLPLSMIFTIGFGLRISTVVEMKILGILFTS